MGWKNAHDTFKWGKNVLPKLYYVILVFKKTIRYIWLKKLHARILIVVPRMIEF